jgi:hypothetical protein
MNPRRDVSRRDKYPTMTANLRTILKVINDNLDNSRELRGRGWSRRRMAVRILRSQERRSRCRREETSSRRDVRVHSARRILPRCPLLSHEYPSIVLELLSSLSSVQPVAIARARYKYKRIHCGKRRGGALLRAGNRRKRSGNERGAIYAAFTLYPLLLKGKS